MVEIKSSMQTFKAISSKYQVKAVIHWDDRLLYLLFFAICFLVSCSKPESVILGSWIEPVPGQSGQVQGIRIEAEGKASSINMQTLVYETWEQQGDQIILTGKSIGNRQTISFSDTLTIEKLSEDTLVLKRENFKIVYSRSTN
jgi:hypothetical protein